MQYRSSALSPVAKANRAASPGTASLLDPNYVPSDMSMTVTALPPNGTVLLADGYTPVRPRQVLTLAQLEALKFRPAWSSAAGSQTSSTTKPAGVVVDAEARLPAGYSVLIVPQDSGARTIGIPPLTVTDHPVSDGCAIITGLPSNGAVLLADGRANVARGQTLTAGQLKRLRFKPAIDAVGQISDLSYLVISPAGGALAGCVLLIVAPAASPVDATDRRASAPASVVESSRVGAAGPAALLETRLASRSAKVIPSVLETKKQGWKEWTHALPDFDGQARGQGRKPKHAPFSTRSRRRPRNASR